LRIDSAPENNPSDGKMEAKDIEITVAFTEDNAVNFDEILDFAKKNPSYKETRAGRATKYIIKFDKSTIEEFFSFYDLASNSILYILFDGKLRPFTRELWLPILWFHK